MENLFITAIRKQLRFPTVRGDITVEQLWELPLQSKTGFDLDTIAKGIHAELKSMGEESFVETAKPNPRKANGELGLEIVKYVIGVIQSENKAKFEAAAKREQRDRLLAILADKQEGKLREMSIEDIQAQIAALGD